MAAHVRERRAGLTGASTIVALSSGRPPAAIAVLRISGAAARAAVAALAGELPPPRRAGLRTLRAGSDVLDRALVLVFPGPASATGEDLIELHCHGGRAVVDAVEAALLAQPGLRRAAPGEFTRRALAHGRIDLAEAEGLADLLAAETEAQRRAAWHGAGGAIGRAVHGWLAELSAIGAELEARIDYDDEDDVPADAGEYRAALATLAADLRRTLAAPPVEIMRDGIRVVVAGPPNAGKSTLINRLAEREVAIVSPVAGTTRDRIEAPVRRDGIGYVLTDTAGLTATADPVEAIGVERARAAIAATDILLWLAAEPAPERPHVVRVRAKADLCPPGAARPGAVAVSALTGDGIDRLWGAIAREAAALLPAGDALALNRHQRERVAAACDEVVAGAGADDPLLAAEHVRRAAAELGALLGINATEAMLDALFGRFCLGK